MYRVRQVGWCNSLLLGALAVGSGVAVAQEAKPAPTREVSLQADIDLDGKPDTISAYMRPSAKMYWINIKLSTGREFTPLSGYIDVGRARMSLSYRGDQAGDIRCVEWRPSKRGVSCGVPWTDAGPYRAIAFDTGQQMFLIHYTEGNGHLDTSPFDHEHAYFRVMPAIEGGVVAGPGECGSCADDQDGAE